MNSKPFAIPLPPERATLQGAFACLEPLDAIRHSEDLWVAFSGDHQVWRFMAYGPFNERESFDAFLASRALVSDHIPWAVTDLSTGRALGMLSLLEIRPASGVIEIGHIVFSGAIQKTRIATEAIYLALNEMFALGYRRVEWKCDNLNDASKNAALRFGFSFEGVFRQHMVVKNKNRDTAWFSMIDGEWPRLKHGFECWLSPANFDGAGRQKSRLARVEKNRLFSC